MLKKIVLGTLLVGLIGVLVVGAIIRTVDKTDNVAEARGLGHGQSTSEIANVETQGQGQGQGQGRGRSVGDTANGQSATTAERSYPNYDEIPEEMSIYEGTVILSPETGADLVILTEEGEEITVGTGPGYMEEQGLTLQAGEQVQVLGYWEDGELKAAQLTRLQDGQTVTLRDELGRPAWSGAGSRIAASQPADTLVSRGAGGRGQGGGYASEGNADALGDGTGTGQAQVDEWLTLSGTVTSADASLLAVQLENRETIEIEGRPWSFAQELGFTAAAGDEVELFGFYENDEFEVGRIDNLTTGLSATIRDETGRPNWAGGGRRGS